MTLPEPSLHPASGDDRMTLLDTLEFVARRRVQLAQMVGLVVGHRMSLQPDPQVFDRIHVRRVGWQECNLNVPLQAVQILPNQTTAMGLQAIPNYQQMRHTGVWPKRTPCMRSMTAPARLRVHNSVPNPCSVGLCRRAARIDASCPSFSWAGRPRSGTSRSASIPPSSSNRFHVYAVWRTMPTTTATSAQLLPASSSRPAFSRFFPASRNRFCTRSTFSSTATEDVTCEMINGCL